MTGDKFVLRWETFVAVSGFSITTKAACESERIVRCVGKDSSEGRRDRLDTGVREANAEIQSGSYFGRIDRPCDIDRVVIRRMGDLSKQRAPCASDVSFLQPIL